jgi:hypothetical protein
VASNATSGNNSLTVQVASVPPQQATVDFFVQVPTSLSALTVSTLATGTTGDFGCMPTQNFGIKVAIVYQALDQDSHARQNASMEPQETITDQCINGSCSDPQILFADIGPSRISGTSKFTGTNGQFKDAPLGICGTASFTATSTQNIDIRIGQLLYPVRTNLFSFTGPSSGHCSVNAVPDINDMR